MTVTQCLQITTETTRPTIPSEIWLAGVTACQSACGFGCCDWLAVVVGERRCCRVVIVIRNEMAEEEQTSGILQEIFTSPLNISLLCLCLFLLYKIVRGDKPPDFGPVEEPLPKLKKRDFALADLREYDGTTNPRILMAVNGKVFDVTRGKKFYGPGNTTTPI